MSRSSAPATLLVSVPRFALDRRKPHWLSTILLEDDGAGVLVELDLRANRHLALALAVRLDSQFDEGKRVVHRARLVRRLPESDRPIRREINALAVIGTVG